MEPIRLALIEDHQALRQGLELLLGQQGCDVVATAGGREDGLQMVRAHEPDVTVIDISLGEDCGIELTQDLLREDGARNIVLYTGSSDTDVLLDGLDCGARGYALKEGAPAELLEAIKIVAAGGTYVTPGCGPRCCRRGRRSAPRPSPRANARSWACWPTG
jgi:DNA-binding NarL/FixJ family response regulator